MLSAENIIVSLFMSSLRD